MIAGKMDRRIKFQAFASYDDGDPYDGQWSTEVEVWAEQMERSHVARFVSDQTLTEATRAYRIRYRTDIDPTWRVQDGDELWSIDGTPEGAGRRTETIVVCSRYDPNERAIV